MCNLPGFAEVDAWMLKLGWVRLGASPPPRRPPPDLDGDEEWVLDRWDEEARHDAALWWPLDYYGFRGRGREP